MEPPSLPIINLDSARFECTFGRGCDGVCCQEGRPPVYDDEVTRIEANLDRILPRLRTEAQKTIKKIGFLSNRKRFGQRLVRNAAGWCVFFHKGCVLHQVGAEEGDTYRYKPSICALFPIQQDEQANWYVRQHGYKRERWDLFCLSPVNSPRPAAETLKDEIALARKFSEEADTGG